MDLFGLDSYDKDDSQANTDSQVIMDDTDENLKICEAELEELSQKSKKSEIPIKMSQGSSAYTRDTDQLSESYDKSSDENSDIVQTDEESVPNINEKLEELNSLLKPMKGVAKKRVAAAKQKNPKTSTPVQKGKAKGRKAKVLANKNMWLQNIQVAGKTAQNLVVNPIPATVNRTNSRGSKQSNGNSETVVAPVERRRSGRLAGVPVETSIQATSAPVPVQRAPRAQRRAMNTDLEVIDLISAPPLILPGVVNLDSDDEDKQKASERNKTLSNLSFDENYELSIKIRWNGVMQKHPLRKHQAFGDLIEKLAKEENVETNQVILTVGESTIIKAEDTPDSINYKISMILSGRIINSDMVVQSKGNKKARRDKNMITIRLQADALKQPLEIFIDKTRKFSSIRHTIAESLKVDTAQLRLKFDGELIDLEETPIDLDFDGGEMIDCEIVK